MIYAETNYFSHTWAIGIPNDTPSSGSLKFQITIDAVIFVKIFFIIFMIYL